MAGKRRPGAADADYMGPAWQWCGDLCHNHRCRVGLRLLPTDRTGVWRVVATALATGDGPVTHERVEVECTWPHAGYESLSGCVYRLCVELDAALTQTPIERQAALP